MDDIKDSLFYIGQYNNKFNDILNINILPKEIYQSKGLINHVKNRHNDCVKYMKYISDIIKNPDYIGINPKEKCQSIELIKKYDKNILIGIKVDFNGEYLYVSTLHEIKESKIERRLLSGRLVKYN